MWGVPRHVWDMQSAFPSGTSGPPTMTPKGEGAAAAARRFRSRTRTDCRSPGQDGPLPKLVGGCFVETEGRGGWSGMHRAMVEEARRFG